jgi:hypothetical protein
MTAQDAEDIINDVDDDLGALEGAPGLRGAAIPGRILAKFASVARMRTEELPDPLQYLQDRLDELIFLLSVCIDSGNRRCPLTLTYLALNYAREDIGDLVHEGREPDKFTAWPRLWEAMLSRESGEEHGRGVHMGYYVALPALRAAEQVLRQVRATLQRDDWTRLIVTGCLRLFSRCPIPFRDLAWRARENDLYLLRSPENPSVLLFHVAEENPLPIE